VFGRLVRVLLKPDNLFDEIDVFNEGVPTLAHDIIDKFLHGGGVGGKKLGSDGMGESIELFAFRCFGLFGLVFMEFLFQFEN
jgi:hypothetical protein